MALGNPVGPIEKSLGCNVVYKTSELPSTDKKISTFCIKSPFSASCSSISTEKTDVF